MKKISVVLILIISTTISGCMSLENVKEKVENTNNIENKEIIESTEIKQSIYCDDCKKESKGITTFCPNCGVKAKWFSIT